MNRIYLALLTLMLSPMATATLITVDADQFAEGTNLSNAFAGVTLTAVGGGFGAGSDVFGVNPSTQSAEPFTASTGSLTFGTDSRSFPHLFREPSFLALRVDFASATDYVAIDYVSNDGNDTGFLQVFDQFDTLLGTYLTASLSTSQFETMSFSSGSANIAYILASGDSGASSGGLDNLRYNQVPAPGTLAILSLGLLGLNAARRRRRAV